MTNFSVVPTSLGMSPWEGTGILTVWQVSHSSDHISLLREWRGANKEGLKSYCTDVLSCRKGYGTDIVGCRNGSWTGHGQSVHHLDCCFVQYHNLQRLLACRRDGCL